MMSQKEFQRVKVIENAVGGIENRGQTGRSPVYFGKTIRERPVECTPDVRRRN